MVVSTIEPKQLMDSLGKEKIVLIPLSEYQALLDRLNELEHSQASLQAEINHQAQPGHELPTITDDRASLNPVSLRGAWGPVVVDEDDFAAARHSLFKPLHDGSL